jgi:hypothetical protein
MPEPASLDEVRDALASVVIRSPGELEIGGVACRVPDPIDLYRMSAAAFATSPMLALLQAQIYSRLYCRSASAALAGEDLTPLLAAANQGEERWEEGWVVAGGAAGGMVTATRDGVSTNLLPEQYVVPPGGLLPVGTPLTARLTVEAPRWQEGFYYALGEVPIDVRHESRMVRVYWNVDEGGAADLVSAVTGVLNAFRIPFRFKVLNRRGRFNRVDAAVLYAPKRWFGALAELLPRIADPVRGSLGHATPLMTCRLAPGVAVAEDPGTAGDSFGTHRARLLAMAVWNSYTGGSQDVDTRMAALEALFRASGLSLERPYLNAGSADPYASAAFGA